MSYLRTTLRSIVVVVSAFFVMVGVIAVPSLAATVIYMPGFNYPEGDTSMQHVLQGMFDQPDMTQIHLNDKATHPATLGLLNGLRGMSGDDSVATSIETLAQQVKVVRTTDPDGKIYLVGYSHGGLGVSTAISQMMADGVDLTNVEVYTLGAPLRPQGGILTRFPEGFYIPIVRLTAGAETPTDGPKVTEVSIQYDGISDAPTYPLNLLASASAILGYFYYHPLYSAVDLESPDNIVRESGNLIDVLVPMKPAVLVPLEQIGIPKDIVDALVPLTKALVETGYDRTGDPAVRQTFRLLPPVSQWGADARSVIQGAKQTAHLLKEAVRSRKEALHQDEDMTDASVQSDASESSVSAVKLPVRESVSVNRAKKALVEPVMVKPDKLEGAEARKALRSEGSIYSRRDVEQLSVAGSVRDALKKVTVQRSGPKVDESQKWSWRRGKGEDGVEVRRLPAHGVTKKEASSEDHDAKRRDLKDAS